MTGPCTAGFESLASLPETKLEVKRLESAAGRTRLAVRNAGERLAFFVRVAPVGADSIGVRYSDKLSIRKVYKADELKRFKELEGKCHYMGKTHSGGETMRLVVEDDGEWVALMVWGSSSTSRGRTRAGPQARTRSTSVR